MPAIKKWTPEEEAELRRLTEARFSISVISERLGRSKRAVIMRQEKLGYAVNSYIASTEQYSNAYSEWTLEEERNAKILYKNGKSTQEISKYIHRSPSAIWKKLVQMKVINTVKEEK